MKASKVLTVSVSVFRGQMSWRFSLSKNISPSVPDLELILFLRWYWPIMNTHTKQQQDKCFKRILLTVKNPTPICAPFGTKSYIFFISQSLVRGLAGLPSYSFIVCLWFVLVFVAVDNNVFYLFACMSVCLSECQVSQKLYRSEAELQLNENVSSVCVYVCVCVCIHACTHACMHVCTECMLYHLVSKLSLHKSVPAV